MRARPDGPPIHEVTVGGNTFRVLHSPRADAAHTYLLVHGIGMSHRYLRRLHAELAHNHAVVSVDLPGFGGLPQPPRELDVPAMAAAIARLLAHLQLPPVVAVGHSMGSQWVIELAAQRPELVTHVVAMGPVADDRHRTPTAQALALALDVFREPLLANWLVLSDYVRCGIPWYLRQLRHMLAYRIEDRVRALARPLLVIRGARDPIAGAAWCRRLSAGAADAETSEIPGSGHVVQHSSPRRVAEAIVAFRARQEAR